ncbi:hypothetical protein SeLEV6574_g02544 [Synchytrium endobioticum]|uniref:Uncharacterized protein n=1 Tax=Synchytrium endobioticum TaxID=286115 RepID=A0A507D7T7_9FUNG|nr:hypothetical protein SeLEV6574_g02544 [Synchytrium endobioticum]
MADDDDMYTFRASAASVTNRGQFHSSSSFENASSTIGRATGARMLGPSKGFTSYNSSSNSASGSMGIGGIATGVSPPFPPSTAAMMLGDGRPKTASVRAAGYSSRGRRGTKSGNDPTSPLKSPMEAERSVAEETIHAMEKQISNAVDASALAAANGELELALEMAVDAIKKEKRLAKAREHTHASPTGASPSNSVDLANPDLTYCVLLNLAARQAASGMLNEALNTYMTVVKNKAIKMYRMALDQLPSNNQAVRLKIMRNIGNAFVKVGQFQDAITSFEAVMDVSPEFHTGFNLVLCYFALGDAERMKRGLQKLLSIKHMDVSADATSEEDNAIADDPLTIMIREKKTNTEKCILLAARLIAPAIGDEQSSGYDWVVESMKASTHLELARELEIAKALHFLKKKDFAQAIETFRSFEKREAKLAGTASANLSFLYFLEGDFKSAEKYAEMALASDRYNSKVHNNRGNCYFAKGQYDQAKIQYTEAISVDALCLEAMFNLALTCKRLNQEDEAMQWLDKLQTLTDNNAEILYHIADMYEKRGDVGQAFEQWNLVTSIVPTDPGILTRMAEACDKDNEKGQAYHYYLEAYRYAPCKFDVISWLGDHYIHEEMYEQALRVYKTATLISPLDVRWHLAIARCMRTKGDYQNALDVYRRVHSVFPENVECLQCLVRICSDLRLKDAHDFTVKLKNLTRDADLTVLNDDASPRKVAKCNASISDAMNGGSKPRSYSETGEAAYRTTESCIPVNRPMPTSNAPIEFEDDVDGMLPD